MNKECANLLITCAGGEMMPYLSKYLSLQRQNKFFLVGVDASDKIRKNNFDRIHQVPIATSTQYISEMLALCKRYNIDLIVPCSDEEAKVLDHNRQKFTEVGIVIACPDMSRPVYSSNKINMYNELERLGFPIPPSKYAYSKKEFLHELQIMRAQYDEIVVKPAFGRGGRGVYILSDDCELDLAKKQSRQKEMNFDVLLSDYLEECLEGLPLVISQCIKGPILDIDVLADKGICYHVVPRKRLIPELPNAGQVILEDKQLTGLAEKIATLCQFSYLTDIDMIQDSKTGKYYVLEVNPRPSGSSVFSLFAGVPLWENLIAVSLGLKQQENFSVQYMTYKKEALVKSV